jgi:hypothetical protein
MAALNVFNAAVWTATAGSCRRVLEGIVKNLLPEDSQKGPLYEQLNKLKLNIDLNKPLMSLAEALREGGNLGAHFEESREPDQPTASQMLDYLEYLMEYFYVLPAEVESFHAGMARPSQEATTRTAPGSPA